MRCSVERSGVARVRVRSLARCRSPRTVLSAERQRGLAPPGLARWIERLASFTIEGISCLPTVARGNAEVPGSDHLIASSRPEAVVEAVLELVEQARSNR